MFEILNKFFPKNIANIIQDYKKNIKNNYITIYDTGYTSNLIDDLKEFKDNEYNILELDGKNLIFVKSSKHYFDNYDAELINELVEKFKKNNFYPYMQGYVAYFGNYNIRELESIDLINEDLPDVLIEEPIYFDFDLEYTGTKTRIKYYKCFT